MTCRDALRALAATAFSIAACSAHGQATLVEAPPPQPVLTLSASATKAVTNDRMHAVMRAEADRPDAAQAANDVNARMARALAHAKAAQGVDARTAGYSSYPISEPNVPIRWRVSQTLVLEGRDFVALSALVSQLQGTDGLLLSGLDFTVSPTARRVAEDALTQEAIRGWQRRAELGANAFGAKAYRTGRITIQANDFGGPRPMFKAGGVAAAASAPVTIEGGTTDVTVTVSGEAILETPPR